MIDRVQQNAALLAVDAKTGTSHVLLTEQDAAWINVDLTVPRWLPDGSGIVVGAMVLTGHLSPEATAAELERREKDPVKAHVTEDRVFRFWDQWLTTGEVPHLFLYDLARGTLRDLTPESRGLVAIATGFRDVYQDDHEQLAAELPVYDALYAGCTRQVAMPA